MVIVTDRTKLDRQIAGVFETCGFPNPKRADSVRDLRRILTHPTGKTMMSTIQKFQVVGDRNDLNARVKVLEPEDVRAAFDLAFRRFSQSMDMLLPDRRALAYHADLRWLGKIRGTARARYRDDRLDLSGCGEKVRKLITDAVAADGIRILVKEVPLFSPEFEEKVGALETNDAKASEIEHAIRHEINVRVEENPVFYQSLRERLEAIIEERRQQRLDAAEQLSLLAALREELRGGWLHVPAPEGAGQSAQVRSALVTWFRRHAERRLPERGEICRIDTRAFLPSRGTVRSCKRPASQQGSPRADSQDGENGRRR